LSRRLAIRAGLAGPIGFLAVSFSMAALRTGLIEEIGWVSWPSSMALGGVAALPQILAFLWLGIVCYPAFAVGALRPRLGNVAAAGMLAVAAGDVLLAFPTDGPGVDPTWHGTIHLTGVLVATVATIVTGIGVTVATWHDPEWCPWRIGGMPMLVAATAVGAARGFDAGWAKVVYVLGITLPVALVARLLEREEGPR
jgi:hypothetical protein